MALWLQLLCNMVSCPIINPVPKFVHFLDNLNFGVLLDFFLSSVCLKLCNLTLVICLLIENWPNLHKSKFLSWSNPGTKGVEHWATYPNKCDFSSVVKRVITNFDSL